MGSRGTAATEREGIHAPDARLPDRGLPRLEALRRRLHAAAPVVSLVPDGALAPDGALPHARLPSEAKGGKDATRKIRVRSARQPASRAMRGTQRAGAADVVSERHRDLAHHTVDWPHTELCQTELCQTELCQTEDCGIGMTNGHVRRLSTANVALESAASAARSSSSVLPDASAAPAASSSRAMRGTATRGGGERERSGAPARRSSATRSIARRMTAAGSGQSVRIIREGSVHHARRAGPRMAPRAVRIRPLPPSARSRTPASSRAIGPRQRRSKRGACRTWPHTEDCHMCDCLRTREDERTRHGG